MIVGLAMNGAAEKGCGSFAGVGAALLCTVLQSPATGVPVFTLKTIGYDRMAAFIMLGSVVQVHP